MMSAITLVSLACTISNPGSLNTASLEAQINAEDGAKIQAIIDSGACLPENMEKLLKDTRRGIESGDMKIESSAWHPAPSEGCT